MDRTLVVGLFNMVVRCLAGGMAVCLAFPQSPGGQDVTIRTTTRMVELTLIATDSKGRPITDLKPEDVEIFDEGRAEKISMLRLESRVRPEGQFAPARPDVFSNRNVDPSGMDTSINIILIDVLNTRFSDQVYSKAQIIKFLQQLHPDDRVALYTLNDDIRVLHDFTRDARPLIAALDRFRGVPPSALDSARDLQQAFGAEWGFFNLQSIVADSNAHEAEFAARVRVEKTLRAMESIALHTGRFAGRKNLIWVSGGFPFWIGFDPGTQALFSGSILFASFAQEIHRTTRLLSDANIAIYPVDAKGLGADELLFPPFLYGEPSGPPGTPSPPSMLPRLSNRESMLRLAEDTGGRAFYNTNDIFGAVRSAVEDSRANYLVGYYPTHGNWNGKFREIKLKAKRKGVKLRYRRGYFASPGGTPDDDHRRVTVQAAILNPLDATTIGIEVRPEMDSEPDSCLLQIKVDPRNITLEEKDESWSGKIEVVVAGPTPEGAVGSGEAATLLLDLTRETHDRMLQEGLKIGRKIRIAPGTRQLRVVVYDWPTGTIGSVTIPVTKLGLDRVAPN